MWLSELRIVLPDQIIEQGALRVADGHIAEIIMGDAPRSRHEASYRLPGLTAIPGLIDLHGDMLEREVNPRPNAEVPVDLALLELDKRLVATGITTAYAAISFAWYENHATRSDERAQALIHAVNELAPMLLAEHRVHARFEIRNPKAGAVLESLLHAGNVHLVSLMDHTPGQGQYRDIERYVQNIVAWRQQFTNQSATEADVRQSIAEDRARPKGWDAARTVSAIAQRYRIPLASHDDDTAAKVQLVHDLGVTISEFPVTEEAAAAAKAGAMNVSMGAPNALRGGSLSGNLNAAMAVAQGLADTLASDYYPAAMLHAAFAFAERGIMPLPHAINHVSKHPAEAVGLHDRGRIAVGCRADVVLVEEAQRPRVRATLRGGVPVYWDRRMAELVNLR